MEHALICPPLKSSEPDVAPTFNVLIAYEDFETGKQAKKTYDFLVENLGHDCQFSHQMWKFDVLALPKLRELAANDAAAADIIIVSTHGDDLPQCAKTWIESWLDRASPLALVSLFDCAAEEAYRTLGVRNYLAEVAHRGKMEFFAQPVDWPGETRADELPFQHTNRLNGKTRSTLTGAVLRDVAIPRWGINE
jgi:hypothetical protein